MDAKEQRRLTQPFAPVPAWREARRGRWLPQGAADLLIPAAATMLLFVCALVLTAMNEHAVLRVHPSPTAMFVRSLVPLAVAIVVVLAVYRPWPAFVAVVGLTPVWNSAMVEIQVGPVQVILQTVFVAALLAGCYLEWRRSRGHNMGYVDSLAQPLPVAQDVSRPVEAERAGRHYLAFRFAEVAAVLLLLLAVASTLISPDIANSATGLLHGIAEPIAMGAFLVWL